MSVAVASSPPVKTTGATTYLSGLDGVRALAVAGVLLYHSELSWFQGGFLGVDVFFVLSGFLITGLLAREFERTGGVDIRGFYLRRFRRLVPALILLLLVTLVGAAAFVRDAAPRLRGDALASLFYVSNWWLIANGQSYFEFISRPPLLQHLWSLAIEEQFYLLWPLLVVGLMRWARRRSLGAAALVLSIASTAWMAYLSVTRGYPDADPSRIYFGTDTHCMGLLLGAALAAVWQPWRVEPTPSRRVDVGLALLGVLACAGVGFAYVNVGERAPVLYRGGFLLLAATVCGLIVAASRPGATFGRLLGRQPLRWIGERSYGLYLWHWPIFVATRPGLDLPVTGVPNLILRLALTVAVTEFSYSVVERPIRDGALARWFSEWRNTPSSRRRPLAWRAAIAAMPAAGLFVAAALAMVITPAAKPGGEIAADVAEAMGLANGGPTKVTIERFAAMPPGTASTTGTLKTPGEVPAATASLPAAVAVSVATVNAGGLTAVGDSVLLGARFQLAKSIRGVQIDAEVGRQAAGVLQRLRDLHSDHLLAPTVLLHLGNNGSISESQLRRSLEQLADRDRVIVVNAHAPRRWVSANNEMLSRIVVGYPNAVLLDWAAISTSHPEFFASDDIHLTASGQQAFVNAVVQAGGFPVLSPPRPAIMRAARVAAREPAARGGTTPVLSPAANAAPTPPASDVSEPHTPSADSTAPSALGNSEGLVSLVRHSQPMPLDRFWEAMADCETGGNWTKAGRYSGGLGIYVGSWEAWGGTDFAQTPAEASPQQQVVVANRISTQGWTRADGRYVRPVGFDGWGCTRVIGAPALLTFTADSVIAQSFAWRQRGEVVRDLQAILGLSRDGVYGRGTWIVHVRHLELQRLPRRLASSNAADEPVAILSTR